MRQANQNPNILINMAGGKRKVFTKTARNKRQKEMKNTEEKSLVGASRSAFHLVKIAKLEESEEMRGKGEEEIPLEVDVTTSEREPEAPMKSEQTDDEMPKNSAKYVPPFSRNKKSGNTEGESSNNRSVTRSSTRKRNLLQVLAEVAKQKLEIEDSANGGTTSLATSEKTDSHPSNMNKKEQDKPQDLPPTKKTKFTGRMKINRAFSLNPKRKKKTNQKENKTQMEKELIKNNIPMQEIPKEKEVKTFKEMKNDTWVDDALEEETSKNSTKEKELQKNAVEDSTPIKQSVKISNEADNFFANKESSTSKEEFIAKTIAPDSMLNEMKIKEPYVDTVVQACMDYLIQTVEADISTSAATDVAVDVVTHDNNMEDLDVSTKKMEGVCEDVTVSQADNNGECSATSRNHSNDDIDNSHISCSHMHMDADPVNNHLKDKVNGCKTFFSDDIGCIKDNETRTKTLETLVRSSNKTDDSDAHVVADSNYSNLEKLETEASHSFVGKDGGNRRKKFDSELNNDSKTGHLDDADDNYDDDDDKLENKVGHGSMTNHSDDDDIDVVGYDDKDHDRSHIKMTDVSNNHCSNDISVIDHNFYKSLENSENKLKGANKMYHADDLLVPCDAHEGDNPNINSIKENVPGINVIHSVDDGNDGNVNSITNISSASQSEIRKSDSEKEANNATPTACQLKVLTASPCNDCQTIKEIQTSEKVETKSTSLEEWEVHMPNCDVQQERQMDKDSTGCEELTQEKYDKHDKTNSTSEKQSSAKPSSTALLKCEGAQEMDLDYFIDCTDSQLIDSKQGVAVDGLRYEEDFNLEDLMDCTDSQLVDIENMENQASKKSSSASDPVPSQALIEDGTVLIQDLIKEVSSIKHYLLDKWNRYDQDKKRGRVAFKTVVKKRK